MKLAALTLVVWAGAAYAQPSGNMPSMATDSTPPPAHHIPGLSYAPSDKASQADRAAMDKMMAGMSAPYTGEADRDFVMHMIPHHQGAIDMCETELKFGNDAELKRSCGRIISGQQAEVEMMTAWLTRHPSHVGAGIPSNIQWK